jgi:hypothetical protein
VVGHDRASRHRLSGAGLADDLTDGRSGGLLEQRCKGQRLAHKLGFSDFHIFLLGY